MASGNPGRWTTVVGFGVVLLAALIAGRFVGDGVEREEVRVDTVAPVPIESDPQWRTVGSVAPDLDSASEPSFIAGELRRIDELLAAMEHARDAAPAPQRTHVDEALAAAEQLAGGVTLAAQTAFARFRVQRSRVHVYVVVVEPVTDVDPPIGEVGRMWRWVRVQRGADVGARGLPLGHLPSLEREIGLGVARRDLERTCAQFRWLRAEAVRPDTTPAAVARVFDEGDALLGELESLLARVDVHLRRVAALGIEDRIAPPLTPRRR